MSQGTFAQVPEGQYTSTVYGYIRDKKYEEVVRLLSVELQNFPRSRAALSLLGHCYYMMQDFHNALQVRDCPLRRDSAAASPLVCFELPCTPDAPCRCSIVFSRTSALHLFDNRFRACLV